MDIKETHNKIISILNRRGPGLPIQIAKEMGISSLFVSAFLSELYNEKRIKISYLKVGGSPLYFLEGHEWKLENYYQFMHPKEIEAFQLLKENKILKDSEQEPAIRVALRSIRDFAIGFKIGDEIYWRYFLFSELEAVNLVKSFIQEKSKPLPLSRGSSNEDDVFFPVSKPEKTSQVFLAEKISENFLRNLDKPIPLGVGTHKDFLMPIEVKREIKRKELEVGKEVIKMSKENKESDIETKESDKETIKSDKETVKLPVNKKSPIKTKSDFVLKVVNFIKSNNLKIIEERGYKLKEYNCILQIKSELGNIDFLTQAKDKKIITDSDLKKLLNSTKPLGIPAFILYIGGLNKKAKEFLIKYKSILKAKKIE